MMKRLCLTLMLCLALAAPAPAEEKFKPGTYEGHGRGYSETMDVTVSVTVDENAITAVEIDGPEEVPFGVPLFETYAEALIGRSDGDIDAVSGATLTRDGIAAAVEEALEAARD